jgi:hypothetical protein
MNMVQPKQNLTIARGQDGLEEALKQILADSKTEGATKSAQYDILFLHGNLSSLLRVDMSKATPKFWYNDFVFGRSAPRPVKDAIVNIIRPTLADSKTLDEDILAVHLNDRSLDKNKDKQKAAGFFSGGRMNIESDDSKSAVEINDTEIRALTESLQQDVPALDRIKITALLQAQKELDVMASPANQYATGGRSPATLFTQEKVREAPTEAPNISKPFGKNG